MVALTIEAETEEPVDKGHENEACTPKAATRGRDIDGRHLVVI
jgi:hypothetical protein